jgi:alpha-tubulin suppressor-like RCC1 family protein
MIPWPRLQSDTQGWVTRRRCAGSITIGGGDLFTCALRTTGAVSCWGANDQGQLGTGDYTGRSTPTTIPNFGDGERLRHAL